MGTSWPRKRDATAWVVLHAYVRGTGACLYKHKAGVVSLIPLRVQLREPGGSHAAAALHRWLDLSETAKDLVMGMLEYDPKKRLTAKEVASSCHSCSQLTVHSYRRFGGVLSHNILPNISQRDPPCGRLVCQDSQQATIKASNSAEQPLTR